MLTTKDAEKACDFIRDNATKYSKAKANRLYLEQLRKSKKSLLMQQITKGTVADREAYAYGHPEYLDLLEALKLAVEEEERIKWMMEAAAIKTELWRSQEATNRGIDKAHR